MSKSAASVFVFAIYLFVLGTVLLVLPNLLLSLFGIPETGEVPMTFVMELESPAELSLPCES